MSILYVDLDTDYIPGYLENDISHPYGWVDFKNEFASLIVGGTIHNLYFKGNRDDPTYLLKCCTGGGSIGGSIINKWPGETEPWRLRVKNLDYTDHGNGRFFLNGGIIYLVEDPIMIDYSASGIYLHVTDSFFKCRNLNFNSWIYSLKLTDSTVVCNNFLTTSSGGATNIIEFQNSMICGDAFPSILNSTRVGNFVDKCVFNTSNFFQSIPVTDCIFDYNAPSVWPDLNDPKSVFSIALFNVPSITPFQFKDVDITSLNCNINNIKIVSKDDQLHVFSNNTYKHAHSKYLVNSLGELIKIEDDYFSNGLYIKDHFDNNNILTDIKPYDDEIGIVRLLKDGSFSITSKDKSLIFDTNKDFQFDFLNKSFSPSDIYGPIKNNIFVSEDVVSFNGFLNSICGLNLSTDPLKTFLKFYNTKINSVYVKEINSVSEFVGIDYDKGFVVNDIGKQAIVNNYPTYSEIIYNNETTTIQNTRILGACFHNEEFYYVKTKGYDSNLITDENIQKVSFPVLCSLKFGELIEFKIKVTSKDNFISSLNFEDFVNFKSIKSVNGNLFITFKNYDCIVVDNYYQKSYLVLTTLNKYNGIITSIDYINGNYIVGISKQVVKDNYNYGISVLYGSSLSELNLFESCPIVDIVVDKYREYIYISTLFEFKIYDYSMNLLKKYTINPINVQYYDTIEYKSRFFLHSDINDIRKIVGFIDEKLYVNDTIVFNDSISDKNEKIISTGNDIDYLNTENDKFVSINKTSEISSYLDYSKIPLFENNLNTIRTKDVFSIFSKDEKTGIVVEFSYNSNLIVSIPSKNNLHDTRKTTVDAGIIPISGKIDYNNIGLKVNNDYIIFRVDNLLKIFVIDMYTGNVSLAYSVTLSSPNYPEITSTVEIDNKILIPFGSNSILELNKNDDIITFSRYISVLDKDSNITNIHQIEIFNGILYCISSINSESGCFSVLLSQDNIDYVVLPIEYLTIQYNDPNVIPFIKINEVDNKLFIIYNNSIYLSFDENTTFKNKYLNEEIENILNNIDFDKNINKLAISVNNESMRNSKNRNFVKTNPIDEFVYKNLYESTTGIVRDFDSDIFYNVIKDIGGHIVISDIYTDRKRIDISIDMNDSNIVKRIKTDRYDIYIDDEIYPKISAYIKDISETEINLLCSLILN